MKDDLVDAVIQQWQQERPDLNPAPMAVMGRLVRSCALFDRELSTVFSEFGLNGGEFDVIATLRRSGKPYTLTPNQLLQTLMLTSGSMTNRIDKLEEKQLVMRSPDPHDRRGVLVSLTTKGLEIIDKALVRHLAKGDQLLAALSQAEREQLAQLLKKLLQSHGM
ncbi:MarR family winged helix-turn-helix transcriptional regulator [Rheinheimera sp. 4Y26]|uniref:MarR family winged helix-turn-helix transcriptional regulator n=1 Tax=Rheinheimera sp. 4Y26 TaxID=2977811 RepID=UPI0021B0FC0B|nr:MarR family transcriptional regulator [Rheinheimera sp. 4Y26]MCT6698618.1 MarR family transcriptional regulator [Rheinheimera sp. 4Y26]